METRPLVPEAAGEPQVCVHTERFEENVFPGPTGGPDPRRDLFFWHALTSEAQVHGVTEHTDQPHRIELHWNGQSLGVFSATGWSNHVDTAALRNAFTEAAAADPRQIDDPSRTPEGSGRLWLRDRPDGRSTERHWKLAPRPRFRARDSTASSPGSPGVDLH